MSNADNTDRPVIPGTYGAVYLTRRQTEVLQLATGGLSYKHIATHLGISSRTVQDRFREMRERTGAKTRSELLVYATKAGLAPPALEVSDGAAPRHATQRNSAKEVLRALGQVAEERDRLDCTELALIDLARGHGVTWKKIGRTLGMGSAQAAQQRRKRLNKGKTLSP